MTAPLTNDPEWLRWTWRLHTLPLRAAMASYARGIAALVPPMRKMIDAFVQSTEAFAKLAKVLKE